MPREKQNKRTPTNANGGRPQGHLGFEATLLAEPWLKWAAHNLKESRPIAALRDASQPKLLSGELRVPAAI